MRLCIVVAAVGALALAAAPARAAGGQTTPAPKRRRVTPPPGRASGGGQPLLARGVAPSTPPGMRSFAPSGPCAAGPSARVLGTIPCYADGLGTIIENLIPPLHFF